MTTTDWVIPAVDDRRRQPYRDTRPRAPLPLRLDPRLPTCRRDDDRGGAYAVRKVLLHLRMVQRSARQQLLHPHLHADPNMFQAELKST